MASAEQQARDMLERAGVPNAQDMTSGDLVEVANLIAGIRPSDVYPARAAAAIAQVRRVLRVGDETYSAGSPMIQRYTIRTILDQHDV